MFLFVRLSVDLGLGRGFLSPIALLLFCKESDFMNVNLNVKQQQKYTHFILYRFNHTALNDL